MANIEFEELVKRYTNNLEQAKKEGDQFKQCDFLENLAICFSAKPGHEDPQKAIDYDNQAINISLQIVWTEMFYKASAALGMVYEKLLFDPDGALRVYEYAIEHGKSLSKYSKQKNITGEIVFVVLNG